MPRNPRAESSFRAQPLRPTRLQPPSGSEAGVFRQTAGGGSYVELATGLCYQRDGQGPWLDSREVIEILPTGEGIARQGQHQVVFPANINQGVIEYLRPDRRRFRSRTLGLAYFDAAAGQSVLIAELQESVGKLVQPNQVLYPNAFSDLEADLRFTCRMGSFEADVVLRQRPPSPAVWGLSAETTRLQVWTEIFEAPAGTQETRVLHAEDNSAKRQAMIEPDFKDQLLSFGEVHFGDGRAFVLEADSTIPRPQSELEGPPVGKEWTTIKDDSTGQLRTFLIESAEYPSLKCLFEALPTQGAYLPNRDTNSQIAFLNRKSARSRAALLAALSKARVTDLLASSRLAPLPHQTLIIQRPRNKGSVRPENPSLAEVVRPGVVLDYVTIVGILTGYTFRGDTTYYVSGTIGTRPVIGSRTGSSSASKNNP